MGLTLGHLDGSTCEMGTFWLIEQASRWMDSGLLPSENSSLEEVHSPPVKMVEMSHKNPDFWLFLKYCMAFPGPSSAGASCAPRWQWHSPVPHQPRWVPFARDAWPWGPLRWKPGALAVQTGLPREAGDADCWVLICHLAGHLLRSPTCKTTEMRMRSSRSLSIRKC